MGTIITAIVVFGAAGLVLFNMIKKRRQAKISGEVGCNCGCSSCSGCDLTKPKQ